MCGKPFVFYSISKTYKVYDINIPLRVERPDDESHPVFVCNQSVSSGLSDLQIPESEIAA